MKQKEEALRQFVSEQFPEEDDDFIRLLNAVVSLELGNSSEAGETRTVKIKEDSDGNTTAKSFKLYNLMKMSFHDLSGLLLKGLPVPFFEDKKLNIIVALLDLLHDFYPKLTLEFKEQDSKLLLTIFELGKKEFTEQEVALAFRKRFASDLTKEQVSRSLSHFKSLRILKYIGAGKYIVREKMTYERGEI